MFEEHVCTFYFDDVHIYVCVGGGGACMCASVCVFWLPVLHDCTEIAVYTGLLYFLLCHCVTLCVVLYVSVCVCVLVSSSQRI